MSKHKSTEEKLRKKQDGFLKRLNDTFGNEYTVLGQFFNVSTRVKIKHNKCEYEWNVFPCNLFSGKSKCPRCSGKAKYTLESFNEELARVTNGEYMVIGEFLGVETRATMKHLICGFEWTVVPYSVKDIGSRCPRCANRERYTSENFNERIKELTNGEYELIGEYENNRTEVKIKHINCSSEFCVLPTSFLYEERRCPECNDSLTKGERKIYEYLEKQNINSNQQQTFEDCVHINKLRFDFSILGSDNDVIALVEFDGKQHFEPVEYFGGEDSFKLQQLKDQIKNDYCEKNNIPLLRIPYWDEKNIDCILDEFIQKIKINKLTKCIDKNI